MPRKPIRFNHVTFDWMIQVDHRHAVEDVLRGLGYDVDGGGTNLEAGTADIFIRPRVRSHKRKNADTPAADTPTPDARFQVR